MKSYLKERIILEMQSSIILQYFIFFYTVTLRICYRLPLLEELIMAFTLQVSAGPPKNPLPLLLVACRPIRFRLQHVPEDEVQRLTCEEVRYVLKDYINLPIYIN